MSGARHGRRTGRSVPRNFYRSVLDAAEQEQLEVAAAAEGLDDEVALLRVLVRREIEAHPENVRLILQGMALLIRAVAARYRLAPADQEALEERIVEAVRALTESVQAEVADA
jgi:hypothetical protein